MKIKKIFKAEIAHRLVTSYSKRCQSFHGHSYLFEVILESDKLNKDAMLMDFGEVKKEAGAFLDAFDHTMVLSQDDPFHDRMVAIMHEGNMRWMSVPYNPTAEMMAVHIYQQLHEFDLPVKMVVVQETLTGRAYFDGGDDVQDMHVDLDKCKFSTAITLGTLDGSDA